MTTSPTASRRAQPVRRLLVGREGSLDVLDELAAAHRWVVVHGLPGVGKTRLLHAFAERVERRSGRSTVYVDLFDCHTLDEAWERVLMALRADEYPPDLGRAIHIAFARVHQCVLLLDHVDLILTELLEALDPVLEQAGGPTTVVGTRRRVEGPTLHLEPLPLSQAVALLRARADQRDIALPTDPATVMAIEELARRLDGLPFSLSIAADRFLVLTPAELLERLGAGAPVLSSSRNRKTSTEILLEQTWQDLDTWERTMLVALAQMPAGVRRSTAERAVEALGAPDIAVRALQRLCDLHLCSPATEPDGSERRFSIPQTVVDHALASADAAGIDVGQVRQALVSALAPQVELWCAPPWGPASESDWERSARELPNLLALSAEPGLQALRMVVAIAPVITRSRSLELRWSALRERADANPPAPSSPLHAAWRLARASVLYLRSEFDDALDELDRAVASPQAPDAKELAFAHYLRGRIAGHRGAFNRAEDAFVEASTLATSAHVRGLIELARGHCLHQWEGPTDRTLTAYSNAHRELIEAGDARRTSEVLMRRGTALTDRGELADGAADLEAAIVAQTESGDLFGSRVALGVLGCLRLEQGQRDEARTLLKRAIEQSEAIGSEATARLMEGYLATVDVEDGHYVAAARRLESVVDALVAHGVRRESSFFQAHRRLACAAAGLIVPEEGQPPECEDSAWLVAVDLMNQLADALAATHVACPESQPTEAPRSWELRQARRLLRAFSKAAPAAAPVTVARDGAWFCHDGEPAVRLTRHPVLRRLLRTLGEHAEQNPGQPLSTEAVIDAVWPDQKLIGSSGSRRVYTCVNRLRNKGLGERLRHDGDGYWLCGPVRLSEGGAP